MKYILCMTLTLLCLSKFKCQEVEDSDTEEVDPVDTNEEEDEQESVPDLDLIPSLNPPTKKSKGKKKENSGGVDSEQTPLTSLVSTVERGTVGLIGKLRERLTSRAYQVSSQLQQTQQRINNRLQNSVTDFMQGLQSNIGRK